MKKRPESEVSRLRREIRADFQLTWGQQVDFARQLAEHGNRMDEFSADMNSISSQLQSLAKQANRASRIASSAATIAGEAASTSLELEGRYRQMGQRFDSVLGAMENDLGKKADRDELEALDERVQRLEEDDTPAA